MSPNYKTKNWPDCHAALKQSGSQTIWIDPKMIWKPEPSQRSQDKSVRGKGKFNPQWNCATQSGNTAIGGDHNVFFHHECEATVRCSHALLEDRAGIENNAQTLNDLFSALRDVDSVVYAHVGGPYADIDQDHNPDIDTVVIIHSALVAGLGSSPTATDTEAAPGPAFPARRYLGPWSADLISGP